jgi:DNA-binding NtrC family response regulator
MSENWDVLVIDDEAVVRDAVRLILGSEGWNVAQAGDADSGLAHEALDHCKIVFCDMMLPAGKSGLDVVREMRRRRPEVPIVLITGYATTENASRAIDAGATAFLAKPFDDTELLNHARPVLERTDAGGREGRS